MPNAKIDKKMYGRMRESGLRKKVAKQLAAVPDEVSNGKRPSKPTREAIDQLEARVTEVKSHVTKSDRRSAGRKAARTRKASAQRRKSAGRKAARTRAKS